MRLIAGGSSGVSLTEDTARARVPPDERVIDDQRGPWNASSGARASRPEKPKRSCAGFPGGLGGRQEHVEVGAAVRQEYDVIAAVVRGTAVERDEVVAA